MSMRPLVVIPVKRFRDAKGRLAKVLPSSIRVKLVQHMLLDVLTAVNNAKTEFDIAIIAQNIDEVRVVLDEIHISKSIWLLEDKVNTLNTSLTAVTKGVTKTFYSCVLIIHDDLPLLQPKDIDYLFKQAKKETKCIILAPSRTKGTNLLLLKPPDIIELSYGSNSSEKHKREAIDKNVTVMEYTSSTTELDIDDINDLCILLKRKHRKTRTFMFLKSLHYTFC